MTYKIGRNSIQENREVYIFQFFFTLKIFLQWKLITKVTYINKWQKDSEETTKIKFD